MSAFDEQLVVLRRQEAIQAELEACGAEDMEKMSAILDELDALSQQVGPRPAAGAEPVAPRGQGSLVRGGGSALYCLPVSERAAAVVTCGCKLRLGRWS